MHAKFLIKEPLLLRNSTSEAGVNLTVLDLFSAKNLLQRHILYIRHSEKSSSEKLFTHYIWVSCIICV